MYLIKTFIPWLKRGKRIRWDGRVIFICLIIIILYNSNTILRKFRQDMKAALNHMHRLMSKFLCGPNLLSGLKYHFSQYGIISVKYFD